MESLLELALVYLAIGAVLFALVPGPTRPGDFHWRNQAIVYRDSLAEVLTWPVALWRVYKNGDRLD